MRRIGLSLLFLLITATAWAAVHYPALTGRVVDDAHILSADTVAILDQKLAGYEGGTTNQVVVVTVKSLQELPIEAYGYQLGRAWGIGQKGKNNGVLLIVAPHERKVRIEVGYGLEGTLTDALSSEIVQGIILPQFKAGHMEEGIIEGTEAIITVLGGKSISVPRNVADGNEEMWNLLSALVFFAVFFGFRFLACPMVIMSGLGGRRGWSSGGSFRTGGGFGGGFSGGGGSFGGGGASGGW